MTECCVACRRQLQADEVALTLKLVSRNSRNFFCVFCLAERFNTTSKAMTEKIMEFRLQGCMLFTPLSQEEMR